MSGLKVTMAVQFVRQGRVARLTMAVDEAMFWPLSEQAAQQESDRCWLEEFVKVFGIAEILDGKMVPVPVEWC